MTSPDRPGDPRGRGAGCRCGATRGARCRGCAGRPASRTSSPSFLQAVAYFSTTFSNSSGSASSSLPCSLKSSFASISALPPRMMSVPRPAMFVDTVIAPLRPACATTKASFSWCLAFKTACATPRFFKMRAMAVDLLDARGADEDGLPALVEFDDLLDDRRELLALGLVDQVLEVLADDGLVRRDLDDRELVRGVELRGLGVGRAGHSGELVVDAEQVLERDRRHRARLFLDAHALFGFDGLVQTVAPAAARKDAPRELVDDEDLAVVGDEVVHVALDRACARGGTG